MKKRADRQRHRTPSENQSITSPPRVTLIYRGPLFQSGLPASTQERIETGLEQYRAQTPNPLEPEILFATDWPPCQHFSTPASRRIATARRVIQTVTQPPISKRGKTS